MKTILPAPAAGPAIYARTAAGGPAAVEAQVARARAAIARHLGPGAAAREYRDINVSGAGRPGPGLTSLLRDLAAGAIDGVVVTDLARFGRSAQCIREVLGAIESAGGELLVVEGGG